MRSHTSGSRLFIILLAFAVALAGPVQAKRLGSGRSTGMQRNQITRPAPTTPAQSPAQPPVQPAQPAPQQPQRSSLVPALAGAAVGAAAGYALARNGDHASGTASDGGGLPWGWLILLGGLTLAGFMFLRRRERPVVDPYPETRPVPGWNDSAKVNTQNQKVYRIGEGVMQSGQSAPASLPDGTDTQAFLRHAKASFQHLQAMNSPEQLEELRKYLTPELFTALHGEIEENREIADFPALNIDLLDISDESAHLVASVRFKGQVSEYVNAPVEAFEEVWHFTKQKAPAARWLLAGIEQTH
ncbi:MULTISPECIES: Tim44 domain-containing protein [Silvimonas]|uniref:Tim44 domain-containing protein n=1 Tax=Silvimonas TaxID=300264 RepID=UPI0024B37468|nr:MULTISPECIES: Tim44-like domain-containing protein [Silvimonas]MDR3428537.1 Tim44-like domain-containing protein [Silvimonas sp.]